MIRPEIGIDLSKLSVGDLRIIALTKGMPRHIQDNVEMLRMLRDDGALQPVEGADLSKEWTIPTSPRTKSRIERLISTETKYL